MIGLHGVGTTKGALPSFGSVGSGGRWKSRAHARLPTSSDASRALNGSKPQRHSISLSTDEWSYTKELTRGSFGSLFENGDATITGTRIPSNALPSTRSRSSPVEASAARGGATWSKNPPHSSYVMMNTVLAHAGDCATALKIDCMKYSPTRMSACGWSSPDEPVLPSSSARGSTNATFGSCPVAASTKNFSMWFEIGMYFVPHSPTVGRSWK